MAEERPAWKHKNVPAWTKNVTFLWDFGRLPSAMYVVKNVVRAQPEVKNIQPGPWKRAFFGTPISLYLKSKRCAEGVQSAMFGSAVFSFFISGKEITNVDSFFFTQNR